MNSIVKKLKRNVAKQYRKILSGIIVLKNKELSKKNSVKVMEKEWDYLIILDACRFDTYKKVVKKDAEYVISGASCTQEWLEWNFNKKYNDVVYIAGNPHFASLNLKKTLGFIPFYEVDEVWKYGWDETVNTVPPEKVTVAALKAVKKHPLKKVIIHYNQPHHPFLSNPDFLNVDDGTWSKLDGGLWGGSKKTIWDYVRNGSFPTVQVIKAYEENLQIVLREVETLTSKLVGTIVITSDHGNLFGEYGSYGHRCNFRAEGLVKVPWIVLEL